MLFRGSALFKSRLRFSDARLLLTDPPNELVHLPLLRIIRPFTFTRRHGEGKLFYLLTNEKVAE